MTENIISQLDRAKELSDTALILELQSRGYTVGQIISNDVWDDTAAKVAENISNDIANSKKK